MLEVAKTSGVSKQTLYHFFSLKEALFEGILREQLTLANIGLRENLDHVGGELYSSLKHIGHHLLKILTSPTALALCRATIEAVNVGDNAFAKTFLKTGRESLFPKVTDILENAIAKNCKCLIE